MGLRSGVVGFGGRRVVLGHGSDVYVFFLFFFGEGGGGLGRACADRFWFCVGRVLG